MSVPIEPSSTVGAVMQSRPETVTVFVRNRMHCPGCVMARFMTLAEAAESHGVDMARLLVEPAAAAGIDREAAQ